MYENRTAVRLGSRHAIGIRLVRPWLLRSRFGPALALWLVMTNQQLQWKLGQLVKEERKLTNEILGLIQLALQRRAYAEFGYASAFEWLTQGFAYSPSAAMRRIQAARLLEAVPEAKKKLEEGELTLTALSRVQCAIRAQEKVSEVTAKEKREAVRAVENKALPEAEKKLCELFPALKSTVRGERRVVIDENTTRHSMNLPNEATENLKRAKEVLSHKFPNASDAEIVAYALELLLDKVDPLQRGGTTAAVVKSKAAVKRQTWRKGEGRCSFIDPKTGHRCNSRYQIQIDHIRPKARGGGDDPENLRLLCREHNLFEAEKCFGKPHMEKFRRPA